MNDKTPYHALRVLGNKPGAQLAYSFWDYGKEKVHSLLSSALERIFSQAIERRGDQYLVDGLVIAEVREGDGFAGRRGEDL